MLQMFLWIVLFIVFVKRMDHLNQFSHERDLYGGRVCGWLWIAYKEQSAIDIDFVVRLGNLWT